MQMTDANTAAPATAAHGEVLLRLPLSMEYALVARTVVSACGSLVQLTNDQLDDLRLLSNELMWVLTELGAGPIEVRLLPGPARMEMDMSVRRAGDRELDESQHGVVRTLLDVVAASSSVSNGADRIGFRAVVPRQRS